MSKKPTKGNVHILSSKKALIQLRNFLSKPEGFFLVFSILFGLLFVFLVPPLETPDENSHFLRAYQISDANLVSQKFEKDGRIHYGSNIPISVNTSLKALMGNVPGQPLNKFDKSLLRQYLGQPLDRQKTEKTIIEAGGMYSPVVYIPQLIGINFGKIFNASPLILTWLARLVNLLFWVVIIFLAIKILPFAKWALVILALSPIAVFISGSSSPDVLNISLSFLFVSMIFSTFSNKQITKRFWVILLAVLSVLALSKPVCLLFALLFFAIPVSRFKSTLKYIAFCIGGLLLAGTLFVIWNYQVRDIIYAAVYSQSGGLYISVNDQLSYILHNPFEYMKIILNNYVLVSPGTYGDAVLITFFGVLGWLDTHIPLWTIMLYLLALFMALLHQFGRGIALTVKQKAIVLGVFMLFMVGNITAMYFNATPVGNHVISGVQGRYFIPATILLLGLFTARKKLLNLDNKSMMFVLLPSMAIVLIMTAYSLFHRFYI